jgi:hypothetical protein
MSFCGRNVIEIMSIKNNFKNKMIKPCAVARRTVMWGLLIQRDYCPPIATCVHCTVLFKLLSDLVVGQV